MENQKTDAPASDDAGNTPAADFPVVGIGASSGGLEALEEFLIHMPADSGMAFIVVTHQHPGHASVLPELLGKDTRMPVRPVREGVRIEPDHVYVVAPGYRLAIQDGVLHHKDIGSERARHLPIDYFFRSLAADQQENAIGVILSGAASDGALGLRAIKGESGLVVAQEPNSAKSQGMPESAIATGLVDFVATPAAIPGVLVEYVGRAFPRDASPSDEAPLIDEPPLESILHRLLERTGSDFSAYKKSTVKRRIERRMHVHGIRDAGDFVRYTETHPEELDALFKDLLISVTSFFRDPEAFEVLAGNIRRVLEAHDKNLPYRVWVPGCATGEEVYSLAILLREGMNSVKKHPKAMIFGTDLDRAAISTGRAGLYEPGIIGDIDPAYLERYFTKEDGGYRVQKEVRDMVIFAEQNVVSDPPFTKLDLLSCRNLLIYMTPELQRRLLPVFAYSLNPGGLMMLGPHESLSGSADGFETLDKKWKIFRRKKDGKDHSILQVPLKPVTIERSPMPESSAPPPEKATDPVATMMGRLLLARFAPPCVVVNKSGEIAFIHGRTGAYLEPAAGRPTLNVFDMAREGLEAALGSAVREAATADGEVQRESIRVRSNGDFVDVNFSVNKLRTPDEMAGLFMVTFLSAEPVIGDTKKAAAAAAGSGKAKKKKPTRIEALELEIQYTKESLQSAVEELETSNEELTSTNEELQSTNEELQSANEELETSREEMQSLNEELSTVNAELQGKVEQLSSANEEMQNLLDATGVAILFLDNDLCIERYTDEAIALISLIPGDIGRFVGDLSINLRYDGLVDDARQVLQSLVFKELQVQTKGGNWYLMRMMPYRTSENVIEGLVITFVDIEELRSAESTAAVERDFFEGIVNTVREPLLVLTSDFRVVSANASFYKKFKSRQQAVEGDIVYNLGGGEWDIPELRVLLEEIIAADNSFKDFEVSHDFPRLGHRTFKLNARRIESGPDADYLILLALEDVTPG